MHEPVLGRLAFCRRGESHVAMQDFHEIGIDHSLVAGRFENSQFSYDLANFQVLKVELCQERQSSKPD